MYTNRLWMMLGITMRLVHVFWQMLYGAWRISYLKPPIVTIFGGSKLKSDDPYFTLAYTIASQCVARNISVLTGGGPGVMEAANCGANKEGIILKGKSIGIGVEGLDEGPNRCSQEYVLLHYFFARKWLLTRFSSAFIVFPGGFGTLDELFEIVTLRQTEKMQLVPIILVGVDYWDSLIEWIKQKPLKHGLLHTNHLDFFIITDDANLILETIVQYCKK